MTKTGKRLIGAAKEMSAKKGESERKKALDAIDAIVNEAEGQRNATEWLEAPPAEAKKAANVNLAIGTAVRTIEAHLMYSAKYITPESVQALECLRQKIKIAGLAKQYGSSRP